MKSKRTKACEIPKAVKHKVYERDNHHCLWCGRWVPERCACAHFIARAHGGLGIEENIVTLCDDCHRLMDFGTGETPAEIKEAVYAHLRAVYGAEKITAEHLVYDKWRFLNADQ